MSLLITHNSKHSKHLLHTLRNLEHSIDSSFDCIDRLPVKMYRVACPATTVVMPPPRNTRKTPSNKLHKTIRTHKRSVASMYTEEELDTLWEET